MIEFPDKFMPLVYLIIAAVIAATFHKLGVPDGITGLLVGAALTRVKGIIPKAQNDQGNVLSR